MRKLLFSCLFVICWIFGMGQVSPVSEQEVLTLEDQDTIFVDSNTRQIIDICQTAYLYRDSSLALSFQEIFQKKTFKKLQKNQLNEPPGAVYWLKFTIANQDTTIFKGKIHLRSIDIFSLQLFSVSPNKTVDSSIVIGNTHTSKKLVPHQRFFDFYEELLPQETKTYFLYLDHHELPLITEVSFQPLLPTQINAQNSNSLLTGIALGGTTIYFLFALAAFLRFPSYLHFYFVIYICGAFFYFTGAFGFGYVYLWGDFFPYFQSPSPYIGALLLLVGFAGLFKEYFEIKHLFPFYNRLLQGEMIICSLIILMLPFWYLLPPNCYRGLLILGFINYPIIICSTLLVGTYLWWKTKRKKYLHFLSVFIILFISSIGMLLVLMGVLAPNEFFNIYGPILTLIFEATIVSFLVFQNILEKQNSLQYELEQQKLAAVYHKKLKDAHATLYTNVTHEFRTPLTVIQGMAKELKCSEAKDLIIRSSESLLQMVNQMLDLSKLEAGNMKAQYIQDNIIPFLHYQTEAWSSYANTKLISLNFYTNLESLEIDFDAKKLEQILTNLLSNALKFTPDYGKVQVAIEREKNQLVLIVKDTGIGIPSEKLPYIFDRFYQTEASTTRNGEGTGIGLAIVKELVDLMDGTIKVQSEVQKGTTFKVYLPIRNQAPKQRLDIDKNQQQTGNVKPTPSSTIPSIEKEQLPQLLIIEDSQDVITYLKTCLKRQYQILTAPNGKEGVLLAQKEVPKIIICDVMMPLMDGFEVCQILKTNLLTSHIPIILLTAKATQMDKNEGLSYGADAYLTKPFDKNELLIRLDNLVNLREKIHTRFAKGLIPEKVEVAKISPRDQAFLTKITQYIRDHIDEENLEIVYLQKAVNMSRTQLYKKLKALTGLSASQFRKTVRLEEARKLLQEEADLTVAEVAYKVGYKYPSHFSRDFKNMFSVSPKAM